MGENVRNWTKRTVLFAHSYALVPINSELHWWLAVVQLRKSTLGVEENRQQRSTFRPCFAWLDSLPGEVTRYEHASRYLSGYLRREWAERGCSDADASLTAALAC